ncbi:ABC transporter permease [Streptomyces sp. CAI-121]|uniref:ABC transporter permease n=1 Tax=unclassified Streptomyces TaxID=2593676 RepID=UPI0015871614|nr:MULTISPECIES: ABC transporter permease [unclassified Streptomyces]NUV69473.1 ABC transporter permease [Streptomyces sp. CAI-121]NUW15616.1 ABC transporter permease [Streptomyces sp. CAI-68]
MSDGKRAASAPWIRTRLRTAPGAAVALAVLVLVTAFLAAAFPRAVDAYETEGLRHDIRGADAGRSTVEVARPQPGLELPQEQREAEARSPELTRVGKALLKALPAPLRADTSSLAYGVRTTKPVVANEPWLPRPEAKPPRLTYAAQSGLKNHATLSSGTWPATPGGVTADSRAVQGAVTEETAARLKVKVGATLALPTAAQEPITVTITGIVAPRDPQGSYWSTDPLLRSPSLVPDPTDPFPVHFWTGTVLLAEDAGPVLLSTAAEPVLFWRIPPDPSALTGPDGARLTSAIASLESGPGLLKVRAIAGDTAAVFTGLGHIVRDNVRMRDAISPVIAVAALGIGSVAAVVLVMTGALIAARRKAELALMRSRGGSLRGIGGRLLAETSVTVLPASALGLLLAVLAVGEGRWWQAALAAAGVGLLVCVALPLRTTLQHIRPTLHGAREDMVSARPSRRRTVAELTLLVLAVAAVTALRRRGTDGGGTDVLVSGAPVLVALIAALVLVRLYPLPLRLAARPMARLRGAIGFLSLARAGRSSAGGALPLLALLLALATAAFGGSVIAGIGDARDDAALTAVGADARVSGKSERTTLPDELVRAVRDLDGVRSAAPLRIEFGVTMPETAAAAGDADGIGTGDRVTDTGSGADTGGGDAAGARATTMVGVDPASYTRLARTTGLPDFPSGLLKATGPSAPLPKGTESGPERVLPVIASPAVAARLGEEQHAIDTLSGNFKVQVVGTVERVASLASTNFLIVNSASLEERAPTTLLLTGAPDPGKLRAAADGNGEEFVVQLRSEERARYVNTPMQAGAERIYLAAVAAGAGYALLAVLLSLLQTAPERKTLLARLRTMGLTTGQGRRLLAFEATPQALLAAGGGLLTGWATIVLLSPGIDLVPLALAGVAGSDTSPVTLRADLWSLALPAAGVVALAAAVAGVQAWWASRRGSITELRAGDSR